MELSITHWVHINKHAVIKDGNSLLPHHTLWQSGEPEALYRELQHSYPKFFKMDLLCKWAWLGAELLLTDKEDVAYEGIEKTKIAAVLMTGNGCMDVDLKYQDTLATIPSPGLFVYTLSNIMLGEICIRHGFKGQQANLVSDSWDINEMMFWVKDLMQNRGMESCICGWVDGTQTAHEVKLLWVTKSVGAPFHKDIVTKLFA